MILCNWVGYNRSRVAATQWTYYSVVNLRALQINISRRLWRYFIQSRRHIWYLLCTAKGLVELQWNPCCFIVVTYIHIMLNCRCCFLAFWIFYSRDVCPEVSHLYMTNEAFQRLHASSRVFITAGSLFSPQNMILHEKLIACKVD